MYHNRCSYLRNVKMGQTLVLYRLRSRTSVHRNKQVFSPIPCRGSMLHLVFVQISSLHTNENVKGEKVAQACPTLCDPMEYTVHGILQPRIPELIAFPFSRGSPQPRNPALQVEALPAELQGKSKNTEVGSLSLFQGIFLTQGLNQGLLHCRRILYQLSYQGSP